MPERAEDIFRHSRDEQEAVLLALRVGGGALHCHFCEEEIEFDLEPREVTEPAHVDAFAEFMALLGRATGKPVLLTATNAPDAVMFRYSPASDAVEWVTR